MSGLSNGSGMSKTVRIPHLGGIEASYRISGPYKQYKPTVVLVNSFVTDISLYAAQFSNTELTEAMNLLAIDPLGHGKTKLRSAGIGTAKESPNQNFTYWDTAVMNLQVMDALGVKKAFVLGTSQGGWITARMALIAPERIAGILPLGTSMDYESDRTRSLGCWDISSITPLIQSLNATSESFEAPNEFCNFSIDCGFGKDCPEETRTQWTEKIKQNYAGDAGRKRLREAAVNLRDRDGLHGRLVNIKCPVLWLHGDADVVYSVKNAQEEIAMIENSSDAKLVVVQGGHHYLSWTNPKEVNAALLEFVGKNSKGMKTDARALREAVGMVDI